MNTWMAEPFEYPTQPLQRGKVLDEAKLRQLGAQWGRYMDVDGDGITYRTVPGDGGPAYFARGSGHNAKGQYSERADDYGTNVDRLARKFETARTLVPQPEIQWNRNAKIGLVAYGTSHFSVEESRDQLRDERQIETSYYRLRGYPFGPSLWEFFDKHERVYVVEQNRDAQMAALMRLEITPERLAKLRNVLHYNGLPIDARSITDEVLAQEGLRPPIPAELKHSMVGGAPAAGAGE
jgi:2-oxoglutarate ferredoxin oxidoreductase subunit alpha